MTGVIDGVDIARNPPGAAEAEVHWLACSRDEVAAGDDWLTHDERVAQAAFTVPRRHDQWRLGRWTAKRAVTAWFGLRGVGVGFHEVSVLARSADDGWPVVSVTGHVAPTISISHRDGLALSAVSHAAVAVGCDVEVVEPRADVFVKDWFTDDERRWVDGIRSAERDALVTLVWSAKEAALKALGEGLRLDTRSVAVDREASGVPRGEGAWTRVVVRHSAGNRFEGWWSVDLDRSWVILAEASAPVLVPLSVGGRS